MITKSSNELIFSSLTFFTINILNSSFFILYLYYIISFLICQVFLKNNFRKIFPACSYSFFQLIPAFPSSNILLYYTYSVIIRYTILLLNVKYFNILFHQLSLIFAIFILYHTPFQLSSYNLVTKRAGEKQPTLLLFCNFLK